jgi:hypothetical protein
MMISLVTLLAALLLIGVASAPSRADPPLRGPSSCCRSRRRRVESRCPGARKCCAPSRSSSPDGSMRSAPPSSSRGSARHWHSFRPARATSAATASAKISEHARGNALDLMRFDLKNKRHVTVEEMPTSPSAVALTALRTSACGYFTTVLGPGSNAAHKKPSAFRPRPARQIRQVPNPRVRPQLSCSPCRPRKRCEAAWPTLPKARSSRR